MNKLPENTPINFGNKRLDKRYETIMDTSLKQPKQSLPSIFPNFHQLKAVYRFFDNPKATAEKLIDHQYKQTISHIKNVEKEEDILVLQDSRHLNYDGHQSNEELFSTNKYVKKGLNIHPSIAVTSSRINLGLLHADMWTGKQEKTKMSNWEKVSRPIEEKKNYKWLQSLHITQKVAQEVKEKTFFNISDREGDMYDLFLEATKNNTENLFFIVRSSFNRNVTGKEGKLREAVNNSEEIGQVVFKYKRVNKTRLVKQGIKVKKIELDSPSNRPHLDKVAFWAIQAQEKNPPKGVKPIQWLILTDYPVNSLEDAKKILYYYTIRWDIEIFFKVLKSGCRVEQVHLQTLDRLKPCLAFYMSIAYRVMFLLKVGRTYPDLPCDILFSAPEWQVVYIFVHRQPPPQTPPSLDEMIRYIAQLGGYLNRNNDPPPGPKAMWIGIQKMHMMVLGFELAQSKK